AALSDSSANQPAGKWRSHQGADGERPCRFARDRDFVGIAAKRRDIFLHPAQSRNLIHQSIIPRSVLARFLGQLRMREKSANAQPVIDADDDNAFLRKILAIVAGFGARSRLESASVKP